MNLKFVPNVNLTVVIVSGDLGFSVYISRVYKSCVGIFLPILCYPCRELYLRQKVNLPTHSFQRLQRTEFKTKQ